MDNKLTCNVIQDLLPHYLDGLASDKTIEYVEEHLKTCNNCKRVLNKKDNIKKKTIILFIGLLLIGLILTVISFYCNCSRKTVKPFTIFDTIYNLTYSVNIYLMPCLALFVSVISLKAKKNSYLAKVITVFLIIGIITLGGFILYRFIFSSYINIFGRF